MSRKIATLIIDDEVLARRKIRKLLKLDPDFVVVGECANGRDAVRTIQEQSPDVIFLDVQMPGMDGFAVLSKLKIDESPIVVFVTAFDQYAVRAFEVQALDYLLKPFDRTRFVSVLDRAKAQVISGQTTEVDRKLAALLSEIKEKPSYIERLVVKTGGRVIFLKTDEIDWIEAEANYVRLHIAGDSHLLRQTMTSLETELDPRVFIRIHRSSIVNIDRVKELHPMFHGDYCVKLRDGTELTLSRGYQKQLREVLGRSL